jgi:hypothetical protein
MKKFGSRNILKAPCAIFSKIKLSRILRVDYLRKNHKCRTTEVEKIHVKKKPSSYWGWPQTLAGKKT